MNLLDALAALNGTRVPAIRTNDAAALWKVKPPTASKMLERLAQADHIVRLRRGTWLIQKTAHPWALAPFITDPFPCYISLQTALFHHGIIEQIASVVHLVSFARPHDIRTPMGTFVTHRIDPSFFFGFEPFANTSAQIATQEKALVDFLYFSPSKTRAFRSLPELEMPRSFSIKKAREMVTRIPFVGRRSIVSRKLEEIVRL